MGGLNEADRLAKEGGLAAKKASVTKLPLIQMRVETKDSETTIAHPRSALPVDEDLVRWISDNGLVSRHGIPWRFLVRERGKVDDLLDVEVGDGSRRHKAGLEAERRLREKAPGVWPLVVDEKRFPGDLKGHLFVEVDLFAGEDAEWILARIAANSEPGKLPDSTEVLARQVIQLAQHGCEDIDTIVAVMPRGVGRKEVQALARWKLLTPAARARFVEGDLPPAVLSAVLDAPPAEQLGVVEAFIAGNVRTAMKATIRTKKAREEKTGEPATKGVGWKPKKLVATANAIFAAPDPGGDDAVFARGFAAAFKFCAGEKTGKLPRIVTAALRAADNRGGEEVMSAAEALLQLARSFGAAGKVYTDLTFSDDFVAAVEAVEAEVGGRLDRATKEGFEAAYCAGRREWRQAGGWKSAWTTAPVDYDGFGTETAEGPFEWEGKQLRRVVIDPREFSWQTSRYPNNWDEDPREVEARIQAKLAAEKVEREAHEKRRAEGLLWIRDLDQVLLEADSAEEEAHARGLDWKDVRAERKRRVEEKAAVERAARWAVCRATFKDGDTLIDAGTEGYRTSFGWVPGNEPRAWLRCKVVPHYACPDDASEARVVSDEDLRSSVGTLEMVAVWFSIGRMRVAGPEDVVPPRAVVERIGARFDKIARVEAFGKVAWVGRPVGSAGALVVDDDGHLVRAKKLREAAERVQGERYFGGLKKRSFKLFVCDHVQTRTVRFARDGVDPSLLKVVSVCVACGAVRVGDKKDWHDVGCLELNVGGPRDGYQETDRADLLEAM